MAERDPPGSERYPRRERKGELPAFHPAARFPNEQAAGDAYEQAQEALYTGPPNDLSSFRLILNQAWCVTVIGPEPPAELHEQIAAILATGEPRDLPEELLRALGERRGRAIRHAPWTERHYRRPTE
jgi:hypothetical protein